MANYLTPSNTVQHRPRVNGEDAVVLNNTAYSMAEQGRDLERALALAQKARLRMPRELAFGDTVAVIYLKLNQVDYALEVLEDVGDKKPTEASLACTWERRS